MSDGTPSSAYLGERPEVHGTSLTDPFGHVAAQLRAMVVALADRSGSRADGRVVDLGCADLPYRDVFGGEYVAVDLPGNPRATVTLAPDGTVPLPDGHADLVLSTQVLEHVVDPKGYLAESHRLLRPGGHLVLTTHGIMYLHRDPTDYWRWTCDGLTKIVEDAGFQVVEVRGILGLIGASLQLLLAGVGSHTPRWLQKPLVAVFQVLIRAADRITSEAARRENGLVLAVLAQRPPSP